MGSNPNFKTIGKKTGIINKTIPTQSINIPNTKNINIIIAIITIGCKSYPKIISATYVGPPAKEYAPAKTVAPNVIVIIVSGLVATLGYNYISFKAYAIVAGLTGLLVAMILTKMVKTNE